MNTSSELTPCRYTKGTDIWDLVNKISDTGSSHFRVNATASIVEKIIANMLAVTKNTLPDDSKNCRRRSRYPERFSLVSLKHWRLDQQSV